MDRREFLKTLALTGAAVTMKWDDAERNMGVLIR